jgi:hypothetical protein
MQLQKLELMILPLVLSSCAWFNGVTQTESASPASDLPRQYSGTAIGQAGVVAGKSFGVNVYVTRWTTDQGMQDFAAPLQRAVLTDW